MQRQLAAILFADIAGYTRLMDTHEAETHHRLMSLLSKVVEPAIASEGGRVVKSAGDGFLACFASISGAVQAATRIQAEVHQHEADVPPAQRIAFRMGLHSGDIVVEAGDVYGAGVNLAARLQELAEPGSLLISGAVREQLGGNLKLPAVDLGYVRLKNITSSVRVFKIVSSPEEATLAPPGSGALQHLRLRSRYCPFWIMVQTPIKAISAVVWSKM